MDLLLLVDSLPKEILQHIFAYKSHVFKKKTELQEAVDKYLKGDPRFHSIEHWDVSQVEDFERVFDAMRGHYRRIPSIEEDYDSVSSWKNSLENILSATNMEYMFFCYSRLDSDLSRCTMWKVLYLRGWWLRAGRRFGVYECKVGNTATNLPDLFHWCVSFDWLNLSEDLYLDGIFYGCIAFPSADVSNCWIVIERVIFMDETINECTVFRSDRSENQNRRWHEFHQKRARIYAARYQNETLNARHRAWQTQQQRAWRIQQSFRCSLAAALVFCLMYVIGTLRFVALCFAAGLLLIGIDHI